MARQESLKEFVRNMSKFDDLVVRGIQKAWQAHTVEAFGLSLENVPIASGNLARSGSFKSAKITARGIQSSIVYTQPYAAKLEKGVTDTGKLLQLKEAGELSYYAGGTKVIKAKKGKLGFVKKAIAKDNASLIADIFKVIGVSFNRI